MDDYLFKRFIVKLCPLCKVFEWCEDDEGLSIANKFLGKT